MKNNNIRYIFKGFNSAGRAVVKYLSDLEDALTLSVKYQGAEIYEAVRAYDDLTESEYIEAGGRIELF